jgi:hypothetical protein
VGELRCLPVFLSWIYSTIQSRCPIWKLGAKSPHTTDQNGQQHVIPIVAYHLEHQAYFGFFRHTPTPVAAKISPRPTNTRSLYAVTMAYLNSPSASPPSRILELPADPKIKIWTYALTVLRIVRIKFNPRWKCFTHYGDNPGEVYEARGGPDTLPECITYSVVPSVLHVLPTFSTHSTKGL